MSEKFLQLFSDPAPALRVKFRESDEESKIVYVRHRLGSGAAEEGQRYLDSLEGFVNLKEFLEFYRQHDGMEICKKHDPQYGVGSPLLEFLPAVKIAAFTKRFMPGGDLSWAIDSNKSKALYRSPECWCVFAKTKDGPASLSVFADGKNSGCIYFVTPQPEFNICRPIAKSFNHLLERIGSDLPAFLRLLRCTVRIRGADGANYGFQPIEYLPNVDAIEKQ